MKKIILIIILLVAMGANIFAQNKVEYTYDATGNRIKRTVPTVAMSSKSANEKSEIQFEKVLGYNIAVHPDQTNGELVLNISGKIPQTPVEVFLEDVNGTNVYHQKETDLSVKLDFTNRPAGDYTLKILIDNQYLTWNIIYDNSKNLL